MPTHHSRRTDVAVVVLAAGLGTRMKSDTAKVLHELMGRAMILYVVEAAKAVAGEDIVLVVGHQADRVRSIVSSQAAVQYAFQKEQLGTGHAVQAAVPLLEDRVTDIVILCGDVPLLTPRTIAALVDDHRREERDITLLGVDVEKPYGYGRLILNADRVVSKIVEETEADNEQKRIRTVNSGIYCIRKAALMDTIFRLRPANRQKELYLTDIIEIGNHRGHAVGVLFGEDPEEVTGINTLEDLRVADRILKERSMKRS